MKCVPHLYQIPALCLVVIVASGCEMMGLADGTAAGNETVASEAVTGQKASAPDSITVANQASETIHMYLLELDFSQRAYWSWPTNPPSLAPGESVSIAIKDIHNLDEGDALFVAINAERHYRGKPEFTDVGSLSRSWERLQADSFRVQITDEDIKKGEDYYE